MKAKFQRHKEIINMSSDEEGDPGVDNVLVWQNNRTVIHAECTRVACGDYPSGRQPADFVHNNLRNLSTLRDELPKNFGRLRQLHMGSNMHAGSSMRMGPGMHLGRSMHSGRARSPLSDAPSLNFCGSSQRSIADGTESMISEAPSNISCAVDIASAIKGGQYTSAEAKMIHEAVMQRFGERSFRKGGIKKKKSSKMAIKKVLSAMMNALEEVDSAHSGNCSSSSEDGPSSLRSDVGRALQTDTFQNMYSLNQRNVSSFNTSGMMMPPPPVNFIRPAQPKPKIINVSSINPKPALPTTDVPVTKQDLTSGAPIQTEITNSTTLEQDLEIHSRTSKQQQASSKTTNHEIPNEVASVEKIISHSKNIRELGKDIDPPGGELETHAPDQPNDNPNFVFTKPLPSRMSNPINDSKSQTIFDENTSELTKSSFMRRKLFTQTLDITKNKESGDSEEVVSDSPLVNIYKSHKNKGRKCSSLGSNPGHRDSDQQQILELVSKIVPPEDMEIIAAPLRSPPPAATPVRDHNFSDTYTDDEDIFHFKANSHTCVENSVKVPNKSVNKHETAGATKSDTLRKVLSPNSSFNKMYNIKLNGSRRVRKKRISDNVVRKAAAFWDTDSENEMAKTLNTSLGNSCIDSGPMAGSGPGVPEPSTDSAESLLDSVYKKNPNAYRDHLLKIIKNSNAPQEKSLIVNIERLLFDTTLYNKKKIENKKVTPKKLAVITKTLQVNKVKNVPKRTPKIQNKPTKKTYEDTGKIDISNIVEVSVSSLNSPSYLTRSAKNLLNNTSTPIKGTRTRPAKGKENDTSTPIKGTRTRPAKGKENDTSTPIKGTRTRPAKGKENDTSTPIKGTRTRPAKGKENDTSTPIKGTGTRPAKGKENNTRLATNSKTNNTSPAANKKITPKTNIGKHSMEVRRSGRALKRKFPDMADTPTKKGRVDLEGSRLAPDMAKVFRLPPQVPGRLAPGRQADGSSLPSRTTLSGRTRRPRLMYVP